MITLMMEVARLSETSVTVYRTTWCDIPANFKCNLTSNFSYGRPIPQFNEVLN
jgi:hypothetical protein